MLFDKPYYFGEIDRAQAEKVLADQSIGSYLVRKKEDNSYVLSFKDRNYKIEHILISGQDAVSMQQTPDTAITECANKFGYLLLKPLSKLSPPTNSHYINVPSSNNSHSQFFSVANNPAPVTSIGSGNVYQQGSFRNNAQTSQFIFNNNNNPVINFSQSPAYAYPNNTINPNQVAWLRERIDKAIAYFNELIKETLYEDQTALKIMKPIIYEASAKTSRPKAMETFYAERYLPEFTYKYARLSDDMQSVILEGSYAGRYTSSANDPFKTISIYLADINEFAQKYDAKHAHSQELSRPRI